MEQQQQTQPVEFPQPKQRGIAAGTLIGGRYRVQRLLGQGGFGRSYLAIDTQRFDEPCVVKEFLPLNQSGQVLQKAVNLFKKEAKTLYQINHPQIPKFLAGFTQSQRLFIVQELINGVTYAQLLRQRQQQGQGFSETEIIQWLQQLLSVLEYLHSLNLIHRDISPDNIMAARDRGLPVLIDFGLVKDVLSRSPEAEETATIRRTSMVGKFGYSPPEQLRMGHCYPCSDLYALGVTAIVLLTGRPPNALINAESLQWQWQSYVTLKTPLSQILDKLLIPQPRERFQTAREVLDAMQRLGISTADSVPLPAGTALPIQPPSASERGSTRPTGGSIDSGVPISTSGRSQTLSAFIEQCRQELARCVGPIAHVLIDDILVNYPYITPQGFIETLTSHLSDPEQAIAFKQRIKVPLELTSENLSLTALSSRDTSGTQDADSQPPSVTTPGKPELSATFIDDCRQELIRCVGPIANVLLKNALKSNSQIDPRTLIETLAATIPDPKKAAEFRQRLKGKG
jgi:serine/threonine-protein kinase